MRPPSLINGNSFCVRKKTPLKWTLTTASKSASVTLSKFMCCELPALFTR